VIAAPRVIGGVLTLKTRNTLELGCESLRIGPSYYIVPTSTKAANAENCKGVGAHILGLAHAWFLKFIGPPPLPWLLDTLRAWLSSMLMPPFTGHSQRFLKFIRTPLLPGCWTLCAWSSSMPMPPFRPQKLRFSRRTLIAMSTVHTPQESLPEMQLVTMHNLILLSLPSKTLIWNHHPNHQTCHPSNGPTSVEEILALTHAIIRQTITLNSRLAAAYLHLGFHDCVPNGDAGGCDGFLNFSSNPANNGLLPAVEALAPIVANLEVDVLGVSRADLWAYAVLLSAEVSQNNLIFTDAFEVGRENCETVGAWSNKDQKDLGL
jgi:hypothetical protein